MNRQIDSIDEAYGEIARLAVKHGGFLIYGGKEGRYADSCLAETLTVVPPVKSVSEKRIEFNHPDISALLNPDKLMRMW